MVPGLSDFSEDNASVGIYRPGCGELGQPEKELSFAFRKWAAEITGLSSGKAEVRFLRIEWNESAENIPIPRRRSTEYWGHRFAMKRIIAILLLALAIMAGVIYFWPGAVSKADYQPAPVFRT